PIMAALVFVSGCAQLQTMDIPFAGAQSRFDTDGDGVISKQEAEENAQLSASFNRIDTNRSGGIDGNEYAAATSNIARLEFSEVDINGDGVISEREAAAMPVSLREAFGTVDADGDKNVSGVEYTSATTNLLQGVNFDDIDTDGDGVISVGEAAEVPVLSDAYDRVDSDADGLISEEEFAAAAAQRM
ncbi:MAG: EF-hand domain-containing protein, partial [Gammaproteobacteria bacterium]